MSHAAHSDPKSPRLTQERASVARGGTNRYEPEASAEIPTPAVVPAPAKSSPGPDKLRLTPGNVVPGTRYRIIRWLGEGGMGVVYEAEHVDIERRVALKILRFDLSLQPRMIEVFKGEAKAAGRLGSQHVVEIYDFGALKDGRLFFAMELLDGRDLSPVEGAPPLGPSAVIGVLRQVCKGLARAHAAGIVHRDVKPENLILAQGADGRRWIKLVDFGISSMLAAGPPGTGVAGTPHYMSPEQILGHPFDGRLDLYALGCTAYELLTGAPPFEADTIDAVLAHHISTVPPPPSRCAPQAEIPPALDAVILRCLAKDPRDRFPSAVELEAALCEAQIEANLISEWDDLPIPELEDTERRERIRRLMPAANLGATKRSLWPVLAGVSMLAAAGLAAFVVLGRRPTEAQQSEVDALTIAARQAASVASWLTPSPDTPDLGTAYGHILSLEAIEGPAAVFADRRGRELRSDFASTLARQGDELWDHGAKPLASVYYLNALVFDPAHQSAGARLDLPAPLVASYITRAKQGELSGEERALNLFAAAEVEEDERAKEVLADQAESVLEQETTIEAQVLLVHALPKSVRERRDPAMVAMVVEVEPEEAPPEPAEPAVEEEIIEVDPEPERPVVDIPPPPTGIQTRDVQIESPARKRVRGPDPQAVVGPTTADPSRAADLASQGSAALRAGRRAEASALFNQAVAFDRRNAEALMGLSDIYFDGGQTQKAMTYAEKAVEAAPHISGYRIKLGDAYFRALLYNDALAQYDEAKTRGSGRAEARIAKVRAKLGAATE